MKGEMAGAAVTIANPETSAARYHGRAAGTRCQSAVLRSPYSRSPRFRPALNKRVKRLGFGPLSLYGKQIKLNVHS